MVVPPSPSSFKSNKSLIISMGTFRFAIMEKHARVKIWEVIKDKKSSNILHGLSLPTGPPSSTRKFDGAGPGNI